VRGTVTDPECYFDDIGRYHTALRALLRDGNLRRHESQYLDGIQHYDHTLYINTGTGQILRTIRLSYRRLLAYIWLGASEEDIEPPTYFEDINRPHLLSMSKETVVTEIAQNRREHNFDSFDRNICLSSIDHQTCVIGLRGRMFGRMLICNDRYMMTNTESNFHLNLLIPAIREFIFESFAQLPAEKKGEILNYLEAKIVFLDTPDDASQIEMTTFIAHIKNNCKCRLFDQFRTKAHFRHIRDSITHIQHNSPSNFERLNELIQQLINLEADSLNGNSDNPIDRELMQKITNAALITVFKQRLKNTGEFTTVIELVTRLYKRLMNFTMLVHGEVLRQKMFKYEKTDLDTAIMNALSCDVDSHKTMCQELEIILTDHLPLQSTNTSAQEALKADFLSANQLSSRSLNETAVETLSEIRAEIERYKHAFAQLQEQINSTDLLEAAFSLRPDIFAIFRNSHNLQSPIIYARYVWELLKEKTVAGHYFINDNEAYQDEVDCILAYIFGDESQGLTGLVQTERTTFLYAFNALRLSQPESEKSQWLVMEKKLQNRYGIELGRGYHVPSDNVVTLAEVIYHNQLVISDTDGWQAILRDSTVYDPLSHLSLSPQEVTIPEEKPMQYCYAEGGFSDSREETCSTLSLSPFRLLQLASELPLFAIIPETSSPTYIAQVQETAVNLWKQVAQSLYENLPDDKKVNALINFVVQTIMSNLKIIKFAKEDRNVIERLVKIYLGEEERHPLFPLPFLLKRETRATIVRLPLAQRINNIAKHLSIMLTTLNSPVIKNSFEQGIVRLMSRNDAQSIACNKRCYVLRLSNLYPSDLTLTYYNVARMENKNIYFNKTTTEIAYLVDGKLYWCHMPSNHELSAFVLSHCPLDHYSSLNPELTLTEIETSEFRSEQESGYKNAYSSVISSRHSFARVLATLHRTKEKQRETVCSYRKRVRISLAQGRTEKAKQSTAITEIGPTDPEYPYTTGAIRSSSEEPSSGNCGCGAPSSELAEERRRREWRQGYSLWFSGHHASEEVRKDEGTARKMRAGR